MGVNNIFPLKSLWFSKIAKNQLKYSSLARTFCFPSANQEVVSKETLLWMSPSARAYLRINREFKKLRRQLQGKRHIKIELCVKLSLLRLFHVDHVVKNRRSALSFAWHEWFSCKGKEWEIYCCELPLSSQPQIWKFHVVVWQIRQNIAPKGVLHVQHDNFSSFNQWKHWFVAMSLTLPSSNLKLPNYEEIAGESSRE